MLCSKYQPKVLKRLISLHIDYDVGLPQVINYGLVGIFSNSKMPSPINKRAVGFSS